MSLTSKERAYLRGLGQRLEPVVYIGKGNITSTVRQSADEALTARELVKGKVQPEALVSAKEAASDLAQACQAEIVGTIGGTFLLYRKNPENPRIVF